MKYIDADRLRAEIDKRYAEYRAKMKTDDFTYYEGMADALDLFEQYIDSLQQEQLEADFKIEERKWVHDAVDNIFPEDGDFMSEIDFRKILKDTAHHFYELGLKAK